MKLSSKFRLLLGFAFLVGFGGSGVKAQSAAGALPPPPDKTHIPFSITPLALPHNIKWNGDPARGSVGYKLFGDPSKPGPYGGLTKWMPGFGSLPHFHTTDRFVYVVSGTWWVSSSNKHDPSKMYPMHAGTFLTDVANTVHWDGAKAGDEPAVILLIGTGPVTTTFVDVQGKPLPPGTVDAQGKPLSPSTAGFNVPGRPQR